MSLGFFVTKREPPLDQECEVFDCKKAAEFDVEGRRRFGMGMWIRTTDSYCAEHARDLRDTLAMEIGDK